LLVGKTDSSGTFERNQFQQHLFGSGNKSLTAYYDEVSYGQFRLLGTAYGWYSLVDAVKYELIDSLSANELVINTVTFGGQGY